MEDQSKPNDLVTLRLPRWFWDRVKPAARDYLRLDIGEELIDDELLIQVLERSLSVPRKPMQMAKPF
jgi:hypothetical protein